MCLSFYTKSLLGLWSCCQSLMFQWHSKAPSSGPWMKCNHRGHIRLCVISTLNHMHHTKANKARLRHLIVYCQRKECLSALLHKCLWAKQRISGSSSGYCLMTDHDLWSPWISFTLWTKIKWMLKSVSIYWKWTGYIYNQEGTEYRASNYKTNVW